MEEGNYPYFKNPLVKFKTKYYFSEMIKSRKKFTVIFWSLFVVMYAVYSFISGSVEKKDLIEVKGKVTSQVSIPEIYLYNDELRSKSVLNPEITYPVAGGELKFVAENSKLSTGKSVSLLYSKTNPHDVRIYNFLFWLRYSVLMPAFLIACFVYSVAFITINKYEEKADVLPGELDPFIYSEPENLEA
jgi:hypothetical protein